MYRKLITLLLLLGFFAAPSFGAEVDRKLLLKHAIVSNELTLASDSKFYAVFDLKEKKVNLKARGVTYRSWKIQDIVLVGNKNLPFGILTVEKRGTLTPIERPKVVIENPDADTSSNLVAANSASSAPSVDYLEVTDMPTDYDFKFSGGFSMSIAGKVTEENFKQKLDKFLWYVKLPIRKYKEKGEWQEFKLILDPADARAMYWAMPEGTKALILSPNGN